MEKFRFETPNDTHTSSLQAGQVPGPGGEESAAELVKRTLDLCTARKAGGAELESFHTAWLDYPARDAGSADSP